MSDIRKIKLKFNIHKARKKVRRPGDYIFQIHDYKLKDGHQEFIMKFQGKNEKKEHIILKLLSCLFNLAEDGEIEPNNHFISNFCPDYFSENNLLWAEAKNVKIYKIKELIESQKLNRICIFKTGYSAAKSFSNEIEKRIEKPYRCKIYIYGIADSHFCRFEEMLQTKNIIEKVCIEQGYICFWLNGYEVFLSYKLHVL